MSQRLGGENRLVASRRTSLRDVAKAAGVSTMTASRAINGQGRISVETKDKVLREAERLGYRPNLLGRSLRTNRTGLIGAFSADLMMPLQVEVVLGAKDAAALKGYRLLLGVGGTEEGGVSGFSSDGTLLIDIPSATVFEDNLFDPARTVLLLQHTPVPLADACVTDLDQATFRAIQHLRSKGYARIALLAHIASPAFEGYARAVRELGLPDQEGLAQAVANDGDSVNQALGRLIDLPGRVDAVVVVNVAATPIAIRALSQRGYRVGEDIGFVGTENSAGQWSDLITPELTVIRVPGYEIGAAGATRLIERIEGDESPPIVLKFPSELIVRGSTPQRE